MEESTPSRNNNDNNDNNNNNKTNNNSNNTNNNNNNNSNSNNYNNRNGILRRADSPVAARDDGDLFLGAATLGGLHYLRNLDQILITESFNAMERFVGCEVRNKYKIKTTTGERIYYAIEKSGCLSRLCCGSLYAFEMKIYDANKEVEVMHLHRPYNCTGWCFPSCLQRMEVSAPPGYQIGVIEEEFSLLGKRFIIKNDMGVGIMRVKASFCQTMGCCRNIKFSILSFDGTKIGKISRQWRGITKEVVTQTDSFCVKFPVSLDVQMKGLIVAATFLIHMLYFNN